MQTATLPEQTTQLTAHPNGNGSRPAEPAFLLTGWRQRHQVIEALHVASDAKITIAEACTVCASWPDSVCDSCDELVNDSLELIELARLIPKAGAR